MRKMTRLQFLDAIEYSGACRESLTWVRRKRNLETAEDVWLHINRFDWLVWLLPNTVDYDLLYRHVAVTLLQHSMFTSVDCGQHASVDMTDKTLRMIAKRVRALTRSPSLVAPSYVVYEYHYWLLYLLEDILHNTCTKEQLERIPTAIPSLDPLLCDDVRHVVGFYEVEPWLRRKLSAYR